MKYQLYSTILGITLLFISCQDITLKETKTSQKPNIIYILADDLGYGELGILGQEKIETPNLDGLRKGGMLLTQHYTGAPVCAPARCMLMTGKHSGNAHVRGNDEWKKRGDVWSHQAMLDNPKLEGQRPIPDSLITVGEVLKSAGYRTGLVGKWGLGAPETEGIPNKQGFDFFFGYNCQRQAHTLYPTHLWKNEERVFLENKILPPHQGFPENADSTDINNFQKYNQKDYAPEVMHREALTFLEENEGNPFFLYYASPLPHVPLQAPQKWVEYYQKKFGEEAPYIGKSYFPCYSPRATYAAMISYLDEQVGDLISKLKDLGVYENTLIIFSSDNGPTYAGGADTPFFDSAKPFNTEYGRGKGFLYEGGVRVPTIAHWKGKIEAGSTSDHISIFYDFLPTVCDLIDIDVPPTDGISFLPTLLSQNQLQHEYLYWEYPEYGGQQAVRMGKWKAIRTKMHKGNLELELYDLESDKAEQNDVASLNPEIIKEMEKVLKTEHTRSPFERFQFKILRD